MAVQVNTMIPDETVQKLDEFAKSVGLSRASIVRMLVTRFVSSSQREKFLHLNGINLPRLESSDEVLP